MDKYRHFRGARLVLYQKAMTNDLPRLRESCHVDWVLQCGFDPSTACLGRAWRQAKGPAQGVEPRIHFDKRPPVRRPDRPDWKMGDHGFSHWYVSISASRRRA